MGLAQGYESSEERPMVITLHGLEKTGPQGSQNRDTRHPELSLCFDLALSSMTRHQQRFKLF